MSDTETTHKRGLLNYKPPEQMTQVKYTYLESLKDWFRHCTLSNAQVERNVLSVLPFFPESDGKRNARVIDTPISNQNYIHELCIENHESEVLPLKGGAKDIVLIHGYAANLGLFFNNYDTLSSIPGVRIHAIDLLGFGFSSRPLFPNFKSDSVEDVMKVEDWFIDAIEEWREKRGINNFILMGHSFGGYLSACYALKYNKVQENGKNLINLLVFISPVGVERNKHSLLKNIPNAFFSDLEIARQNNNTDGPHVEDEILKPQSSITEVNPNYKDIDFNESEEVANRRVKLFRYMWERNFSPFSIVRNAGPFKSKLISAWTTRRFSDIFVSDRDYYQNIHDYFYRSLTGNGSGEYAITRVLAPGALPRLPLMDRIPQFLAKSQIPSLWIYGDVDWMNVEAGQEMAKEINSLSPDKNSQFAVVPKAGHHLYLDNPDVFHKKVLGFLGYAN